MIIYKYLTFCVITFFLHIVKAKEFGIALYSEDTVFYSDYISAADRMMYYDMDSAEVCAKLALSLAKKHTNTKLYQIGKITNSGKVEIV